MGSDFWLGDEWREFREMLGGGVGGADDGGLFFMELGMGEVEVRFKEGEK